MTSVTASVLSAQSIWNRFVASADTDGDGSLSIEELGALAPTETVDRVLAQRDANGDGVLSQDEMPKGAFSPTMYSQMLTAQEYRDASPAERRADDAAVIADMFARADIDGDGVLSDAEWEAERTLNMSRFVDSGELPNIAFIARTRTDHGLATVDTARGDVAEAGEGGASEGLRPEDFLVGRKVDLEAVPASELPDEWNARLAELRRADGQPMDTQPMQILDQETVRNDMIAKIEAMPMSSAFMTRLIMSLSESVTAGA